MRYDTPSDLRHAQPAPILTILLIQDDGRVMAKCAELDLVTEMDTPQEALHAMVEMIREYAEDYRLI